MVPTTPPADIAGLPTAPRNPLTLRQQVRAVKAFHTGQGAGVAAALSVRADRALDDVDISAVQAELSRQEVRIT